MKSIITIILAFAGCFLPLSATNYFVATTGSDSNSGTIDAPFATLNKAQFVVAPGDTVYIRGGEYLIKEEQLMGGDYIRAYVFNMNISGTASKRICYSGYRNERPVFNLSEVKPQGKRVTVFYVSGSYLHFRNFEIIGTQVTITEHTQSECFRNQGGSNNIYEHLAMHDGMAIGFYLVSGSNNLVLNCDAYNNYDPVSENGKGGNVDGFGGHTTNISYTGNVFKGCRAWYNSDDGFDLISAYTAFTIEDCWSFYNGYKPGGFVGAGDGTGFKAGGYGMSVNADAPKEIPRHVVKNCLAYRNKNKGFYANHHLGGISWYNNTSYQNPSNFCMLNRKSLAEAVDVPGYGHILHNNLSHSPRSAGKHIIDINMSECEYINNSFLPLELTVTDDDFISLDASQLNLPRKADGSLPDINFLRLKVSSKLYNAGIGYSAGEGSGDIGYSWMEEAAILVEGNTAKVVGVGAGAFTRFYINEQEVDFTNGQADLSSCSGTINLKATTENGGLTKLKITR